MLAGAGSEGVEIVAGSSGAGAEAEAPNAGDLDCERANSSPIGWGGGGS